MSPATSIRPPVPTPLITLPPGFLTEHPDTPHAFGAQELQWMWEAASLLPVPLVNQLYTKGCRAYLARGSGPNGDQFPDGPLGYLRQYAAVCVAGIIYMRPTANPTAAYSTFAHEIGHALDQWSDPRYSQMPVWVQQLAPLMYPLVGSAARNPNESWGEAIRMYLHGEPALPVFVRQWVAGPVGAWVVPRAA